MAKARKAKVVRNTGETKITIEINLDGSGKYKVDTGIPFFNHMLELFSKHGLFDLTVKAKGDIDVDFHHTVEDIGITLGETIRKALGTKKGINRYGVAEIPLMDACTKVVLDLCDRPYLAYMVKIKPATKPDEFDPGLVKEFMRAISTTAGMDLHINLQYGNDKHHCQETIFKAFGRALKVAVTKDPRIKGVMSTKGKL